MTRRLDYERARKRDSQRQQRAADELQKPMIAGSSRKRAAIHPTTCTECGGTISVADALYLLRHPRQQKRWLKRCAACGPFPALYEESIR